MDYTLENIFEKLSQKIGAVYLIDTSIDTYTTIKDNSLFHSIFGSNGSYSIMMRKFLENTVDKLVAKDTAYGIFLKGEARFKGYIANTARMRIENKDITISVFTVPIDDNNIALLINEIKREEYTLLKELETDQQINAIKSVYLFSMNIDLIADRCDSVNMTEVNDMPVSQPEIKYSEWRKIIINMFLPEEQEIFLQISDPEYLKNNLKYSCSKSVDCQMMNLEGKFIWVKLIFSRINTRNDDDFRVIFMVENNHESHTRLMADLKKYEMLANNDSLTGILNHGKIESEIKLCIERCQSEKKPVSLFMFDIDYFKKVNDTYGHATGDYVLKTCASVVNEYIMKYGGRLGRWGGEEFICIFEGITEDKVAEIAEETRRIISECYFEKVGNITVSFGVIEVKADESPSDAFKRIDFALYEAKKIGRNKVVAG